MQAKKAGCNHLSGQTTAGGSDYPRVFDDAESFELLGSPPWYEYPLVESQVYSGGKFLPLRPFRVTEANQHLVNQALRARIVSFLIAIAITLVP